MRKALSAPCIMKLPEPGVCCLSAGEGNRDEESRNKQLRPEKLPLKCFRTGVRLPSPPPMQHGNYGIITMLFFFFFYEVLIVYKILPF